MPFRREEGYGCALSKRGGLSWISSPGPRTDHGKVVIRLPAKSNEGFAGLCFRQTFSMTPPEQTPLIAASQEKSSEKGLFPRTSCSVKWYRGHRRTYSASCRRRNPSLIRHARSGDSMSSNPALTTAAVYVLSAFGTASAAIPGRKTRYKKRGDAWDSVPSISLFYF